jgi:hypothetical protein
MNILIQYEGFIVSPISRTYNFHVVDALGESRQFTVQVPSESFGVRLLKFQDGPGICFERLQHEIDAETQQSHAEAVLNIGASEIQEYLDRQHPQKARNKQRASSSLRGNPLPNHTSFKDAFNQTVTHEDSGIKKTGALITDAAKPAKLGWRGAQWEEIARLKKKIDEKGAHRTSLCH